MCLKRCWTQTSPKNDLEDYDNTGHDLVKELVDMYVTVSKNDFLTSVRKEEDLQAILEKTWRKAKS